MNPSTTKIILCGVLEENARPFIPPEMTVELLDSDLHHTPKKLHSLLQEVIDTTAEGIKTVILGYGLCSLALVGIQARNCKLVVPKVDDCISLFLGSRETYKQQTSKEPGTYYMTKGWEEAGITPFFEYDILIERYGQERADFMMNLVFKDFRRMAYISEENSKNGHYCAYTRQLADQFGLRFEELQGSDRFFKKMIDGPWDDEFLIVKPGQEIKYSDFKK
jgi:hypothetical protein